MKLDDFFNSSDFDLSISRKKTEHPKDASIRRFKEITSYALSVLSVSLIFIFCLYSAYNSKFSSDFQKWSMTIDGSIISAFLAYNWKKI